MPNKEGHRRWGNVRKLPSGRYQARYPGPDGVLRSAPKTFARKSEAERYLTLVEAQMARREWIDPERAKIRLRDYAGRWIAQRPGLRPRTVHLYRGCSASTSTRTSAGYHSTALTRGWYESGEPRYSPTACHKRWPPRRTGYSARC